MTRTLSYVLTDVFGETPFSGNQLAVVRNAEGLAPEEMQSVAREFNLSETTFLVGDPTLSGAYPVRIFTPQQEVPFAGHPSLGTAWVIDNLVRQHPLGGAILSLAVGPIEVEADDATGLWWMRQNPPEFEATLPAEEAARVLSLSLHDIDAAFPVQRVSTGLPFVLIPLTSLDAVKRASVNPSALALWQARGLPSFVFLFSRETLSLEHQVHARMFASEAGVPEDPATGSANGCLAGYASRYRYLGSDNVDAVVEQGYFMNRPSLIHLRANPQNSDRIDVRVGGRVWHVGSGEIYIDAA